MSPWASKQRNAMHKAHLSVYWSIGAHGTFVPSPIFLHCFQLPSKQLFLRSKLVSLFHLFHSSILSPHKASALPIFAPPCWSGSSHSQLWLDFFTQDGTLIRSCYFYCSWYIRRPRVTNTENPNPWAWENSFVEAPEDLQKGLEF